MPKASNDYTCDTQSLIANNSPDARLINSVNAWLSMWNDDQTASNANDDYERSARNVVCEAAVRNKIIETNSKTIEGIRRKALILARLDYDCRDLAASICNDLKMQSGT